MKKYLLFIVLLFAVTIIKAQNLVPDSSFEMYTTCPTALSQVQVLSSWFQPTLGTSDYFNLCDMGQVNVPSNYFGYQSASGGNGYAGFWIFSGGTEVKEYLGSNLSCSNSSEVCALTVGVSYQVSMDVSLAETHSNVGCDGLGVYFFTYPPSVNTANLWQVLPFTAQINYSSYGPITDTLNWVTLTDTLTADSAYRYIIVGAVLPDSLQDTVRIKPEDPYGKSYYYVDNVRVVPLTWSPPPTSSHY